MHLILLGLSHHNVPIAVRERLACADHALPTALSTLGAGPGVREVALLSTCNRMELYGVVEGADLRTAYAALTAHLADLHALPEAEFAPHLTRKSEEAVAAHLLRVAGGLDSLVLGEAQILGQVRTALRAAQSAGTAGAVLQALFQQAIAGGKRIQNETALGRGAFSIGHEAVRLAGQIFGDLSRASVLILGAGKMSEMTARHLVQNGVRFVVVANRTHEKAVAMAARLGGVAIHYDTFLEQLVTADIVISSTAAPHPIVRRETLTPILRRRRGKPLFLIDIAVPRDIAPEVGDLDNVFLYNIDDLKAVVAEAALGREQEATRAEAIVEEEAAKFLARYRVRQVAPVITQLQDRLEQVRQEELAILRTQLGTLAEREWQRIEAATRAMMRKVAREPILRLKRETGDPICDADGDPIRYDLAAATREIFGLSEDTDAPTDAARPLERSECSEDESTVVAPAQPLEQSGCSDDEPQTETATSTLTPPERR